MSEERENTNNKSANKVQQNLGRSWMLFFYSMANPLVVLCLAVAVVSLIAANGTKVDHTFSVVLQIAAAIATGVAGRFIYDNIRATVGNYVLTEKGLSAVRSLILTRSLIKTLSDRVKCKATEQEIITGFGFLEKSIGNAIQEWTDMLPGLADKEIAYTLLGEKEATVERLEKAKREAEEKLAAMDAERKAVESGLKESLKKLEKEMDRELASAREEIDRLRVRSEMPLGSSGTQGLVYGSQGRVLRSLSMGNQPLGAAGLSDGEWKACVECGKAFFSTGPAIICEECTQKKLQ